MWWVTANRTAQSTHLLQNCWPHPPSKRRALPPDCLLFFLSTQLQDSLLLTFSYVYVLFFLSSTLSFLQKKSQAFSAVVRRTPQIEGRDVTKRWTTYWTSEPHWTTFQSFWWDKDRTSAGAVYLYQLSNPAFLLLCSWHIPLETSTVGCNQHIKKWNGIRD